jgi:hypothetical protein
MRRISQAIEREREKRKKKFDINHGRRCCVRVICQRVGVEWRKLKKEK